MGIPQIVPVVQSPLPFLAGPTIGDLTDPMQIPVVRVGRLWVPREAAPKLPQDFGWRSPVARARAAVQRGQQQLAQLPHGILTQHALLVAWGEYAQEIGLIDQLLQVAIPQKSVVHTPPAKLLAFFLGTLSGMTHLKDLNEGPHPLAHDGVVLRAWGLAALAHYTNVSRTLAACDPATVAAVTQVLRNVTQPFIAQEVAELRRRHQPLLVDLDLAPRRVSPTSTSFPEAEFSWQDGEVGQGYDAALAALTSPRYGRLFLTGFHHPRNVVPLPRLQQLVRETEARLGVRPRRRTALVQQRLQALRQQLDQRLQKMETLLQQRRALLAREQAGPQEVAQQEERVTQLEACYREHGRPERTHSQLARARQQLATLIGQGARLPGQIEQNETALAKQRRQVEAAQAAYDQLQAHLATLQADNAANPAPGLVILRLDAGFSNGESLAWLIEMGYTLYTKAHHNGLAQRLVQQLPPTARWTPVGKNAEMIGCGAQYVRNCPYPLTVAVERFHTPEQLKHSALLTYRDDDQEFTLRAWFAFYNSRQIIEAGIKEGNVVFQMHPLKMRSPGGIALQEQFALFAANFVRWAAVWLRERVVHNTPRFAETLGRVKAMVRVGANTSAWVTAESDGLLLKFDETGAYPGVELRLAGKWRERPPALPQKKVREFDFNHPFGSGCA